DDENGRVWGNVNAPGRRVHSFYRVVTVEKRDADEIMGRGRATRRVALGAQSFSHHVNHQAARGTPLLLPGVQESGQLSQVPGEESEVQLPLVDLAVFDDARGNRAQIDDR